VHQSVPLNGKINTLGGEKRDRSIARGFAELNVIDGIGTAQEMNFHVANGPGIKRVAIEGSIHVSLHEGGKNQSRDAKQNDESEQNAPEYAQAMTLRMRTGPARLLSVHTRMRELSLEETESK